ncbi:unnamed protein product [Euphydryas editha]|uniref:Uncharacterized protein n=1 Tax=Euphydryas editha TaxID=104508 RepID=A0AAU9UNW4_EUPED|nr:unnamed protein product [Euphydryas editha]
MASVVRISKTFNSPLLNLNLIYICSWYIYTLSRDQTLTINSYAYKHAPIFTPIHARNSITSFLNNDITQIMKSYTRLLFLITLLSLSTSHAKIMRNNALMTKMVSDFRKDNDYSDEKEENHVILNRMQNVLCKNFPTIPCNMIVQDKALKKLIEKSIQQINYKKHSFEKTTPFPGYLTLFPIINNDVSNQQTRDKLYHNRDNSKNKHERKKKIKNTKKRTSVYNRKKLRKFYPHKVKYRDKTNRNVKEDYGDNSGEKLSMSVEVPDMMLTKKHQHFSYKMEPVDPPVWRIDYMKHGEPKVNMFGQDDGFQGYMKTGPNVVVDGNVDTRKDVLHPDVYIKKNYLRKNLHLDMHSDGVE